MRARCTSHNLRPCFILTFRGASAAPHRFSDVSDLLCSPESKGTNCRIEEQWQLSRHGEKPIWVFYPISQEGRPPIPRAIPRPSTLQAARKFVTTACRREDCNPHLGYLGRDRVTKLGQLSDLSQERHETLRIVHHQNSSLINVHQLFPVRPRFVGSGRTE